MAAGLQKTGIDRRRPHRPLKHASAPQKNAGSLAQRFSVIFRRMGTGRNRASKSLELFVYGHPEEALDIVCVLGVVALIPV